MLAVPARASWPELTEDEWAFEMKWDGYRVQVQVDGDRVRLLSRRGQDLTRNFPELIPEVVAGLRVRRAVLDGELVVLGPAGIPDFGRLQRRAGVTDPTRLARAAPGHLMLFDVLSFDDVDATGSSYDARRAALSQMMKESRLVHVPAAFTGDVDAALTAAAEWRLEGVMAKRRGSRYEPGRRSSSWVKLKLGLEAEVVVLGWRPSPGRGVEALLIGVQEAEVVRRVGVLTGGWTRSEGVVLATRLRELGTPGAGSEWWWTRPEVTVDVEFAEWTVGRQMRHPMWRGLTEV